MQINSYTRQCCFTVCTVPTSTVIVTLASDDECRSRIASLAIARPPTRKSSSIVLPLLSRRTDETSRFSRTLRSANSPTFFVALGPPSLPFCHLSDCPVTLFLSSIGRPHHRRIGVLKIRGSVPFPTLPFSSLIPLPSHFLIFLPVHSHVLLCLFVPSSAFLGVLSFSTNPTPESGRSKRWTMSHPV